MLAAPWQPLKKNVISITLSQQILDDKLLWAIAGGQESNFNGRFKLKTHNNLPLRICYESVVKYCRHRTSPRWQLTSCYGLLLVGKKVILIMDSN